MVPNDITIIDDQVVITTQNKMKKFVKYLAKEFRHKCGGVMRLSWISSGKGFGCALHFTLECGKCGKAYDYGDESLYLRLRVRCQDAHRLVELALWPPEDVQHLADSCCAVTSSGSGGSLSSMTSSGLSPYHAKVPRQQVVHARVQLAVQLIQSGRERMRRSRAVCVHGRGGCIDDDRGHGRAAVGYCHHHCWTTDDHGP